MDKSKIMVTMPMKEYEKLVEICESRDMILEIFRHANAVMEENNNIPVLTDKLKQMIIDIKLLDIAMTIAAENDSDEKTDQPDKALDDLMYNSKES